ncbi:hypothetical protein BDR26DRAFT_890527 [Obelidium mucronatum]|nr:hypothetical protein BDR26DRAFT_890527 [Obelidium mucronatum]
MKLLLQLALVVLSVQAQFTALPSQPGETLVDCSDYSAGVRNCPDDKCYWKYYGSPEAPLRQTFRCAFVGPTTSRTTTTTTTTTKTTTTTTTTTTGSSGNGPHRVPLPDGP